MKSKKIIGLTGSIATGKSTVTNIIRENGFKVIDADAITHQLMKNGEINHTSIVNYFGKSILKADGEIDRKKLAEIVFNDKCKLDKLNKLTHENIFSKIRKEISNSTESIIFVDIALLLELLPSGIIGIEFDEIWLVYTNKNLQLERLIKRNSLSFEEAKSRINSQMDIDSKIDLVDIVIENNTTIEDLRLRVEEELRKL